MRVRELSRGHFPLTSSRPGLDSTYPRANSWRPLLNSTLPIRLLLDGDLQGLEERVVLDTERGL